MRHRELFEAAKSGDIQYLEPVGSGELNESIQDEDKANCLHYAARGGHVKVIEFLVKKRGFSPSKRTRIGSTPLHDAAAAGALDVLKWFLENTPVIADDQDGTGATILHLAARYGHSSTYRWLLENTKCDPMKKAGSGALAIHFAVVGGNLDVLKLVLQETPRTVNLQMDNGATPVYLACQEGQLALLKHLVLQAGGSVKMKAFDGMSCLHAAAQNGHANCVRFMVEEQNCNPNDRDFDGATPLHYAASNGHTAVVEWLLGYGGAKVTLDNMGGSPLHNAAELGQLECVRCLLDNGCSADITDNSGLTASELAERCYNDQCAAEIKAKLNGKNIQPDSYNYQKDSVVETNTTQSVIGRDIRYSDQSSLLLHTSSVQPSTSRDTYQSLSFSAEPSSREIHQSSSLLHTDLAAASTSREIHQSSPLLHKDLVKPSTSEEIDQSEDQDYDYPSTIQQSYSSGLYTSVSDIITSKAWSPVSFNRNSPTEGSVQSGETGECESRSVSKDCVKSQETGECESLQGTLHHSSDYTELHPLPNSPPTPPPDYPSSSHRQRTNSDISSVVSTLSNNSMRDEISDYVNVPAGLKQSTDLPSNKISPKVKIVISKPQSQISPSFTHKMNDSEESVLQNPGAYLAKEVVIDENLVVNDDKPLTNGLDLDLSTSPKTNSGKEKVTVVSHFEKQDSASVENISVTNEQNDNARSLTINVDPPPPPPVATPVLPVIVNGDIPKPQRPRSFVDEIQNASLSNSRSASPASRMLGSNTNSPSNVNNDFIAELKKATGAGVNSLKRTKKPPEGGQMTMVYSFGGKGTGSEVNDVVNGSSKKTESSKPLVLEGEFDPKNFLDKVAPADSHGNPIPLWKKQMVARQLAEKTMIETVEKRKQEEIEARFKNMPAWKRALLEKKEAEASQARAVKEQAEEEKKKSSNRAISAKLSPFQSDKS